MAIQKQISPSRLAARRRAGGCSLPTGRYGRAERANRARFMACNCVRAPLAKTGDTDIERARQRQ
eukprot:804810-Lingulodinium_polyedra.AAC.1